MANVIIGSRLPTGLVLNLVDAQGKEHSVTLKGQNADMNGAIFIQPTHCGYTEVDADFWAAWSKANADFPALRSGAIFAEATEAKARSSARERMRERTGLEGASNSDVAGIEKADK